MTQTPPSLPKIKNLPKTKKENLGNLFRTCLDVVMNFLPKPKGTKPVVSNVSPSSLKEKSQTFKARSKDQPENFILNKIVNPNNIDNHIDNLKLKFGEINSGNRSGYYDFLKRASRDSYVFYANSNIGPFNKDEQRFIITFYESSDSIRIHCLDKFNIPNGIIRIIDSKDLANYNYFFNEKGEGLRGNIAKQNNIVTRAPLAIKNVERPKSRIFNGDKTFGSLPNGSLASS